MMQQRETKVQQISDRAGLETQIFPSYDMHLLRPCYLVTLCAMCMLYIKSFLGFFFFSVFGTRV